MNKLIASMLIMLFSIFALNLSASSDVETSNETNIEKYAATGVDIIVLSCAYFGKPADIKVRLIPEE